MYTHYVFLFFFLLASSLFLFSLVMPDAQLKTIWNAEPMKKSKSSASGSGFMLAANRRCLFLERFSHDLADWAALYFILHPVSWKEFDTTRAS